MITSQSKGPSRIFSSMTVPKLQFFGAQQFLLSSSHICTCHFLLQGNFPTLHRQKGSLPLVLPEKPNDILCVWRVQLCNTMYHRPPSSSVHRILQSRILEWVGMPPPGGLPNPGIEPVSLMSPASAVGSLPLVPPGKPFIIMMLLNSILPAVSVCTFVTRRKKHLSCHYCCFCPQYK